MAQTSGGGFNTGAGPGRYGGGRAPAQRRAPVRRAPAPPRAPRAARIAPVNNGRANSSTPSSNGYRSGKAVGSNASGTVSKTAPAVTAATPMTADSIAKNFNQWSGGDSVYMAQKKALASDLATYRARNTAEANTYGLQNAANLKQLQQQRTNANQDLVNDYTARGMLGGAENYAQTQFNTDWNKRVTDFNNNYANWKTQQGQALQDYVTNNANQLTKAQQDAIARRVASYGL